MKSLHNLSYGMYIVGCSDSKLAGCIVNSVCQISSNPALITVSINHDNYTNEVIKRQKEFSISVLSEDTDPQLIGLFGYQSSRDVAKFDQIDYDLLDNLPIVPTAICAFTCQVKEMIETNTHTIFLAEVKSEKMFHEKTPMTYKYYHDVLKGKSPKNAPTYENKEEKEGKIIYRCPLCGYEIAIADLPADFVCPICGAKAQDFEKIILED